MKINFNSSNNLYLKREPVAGGKDLRSFRGNSTDVAEFSRGGTAAPDKSLMGAKAVIQRAVSAQADPARLEALRQSVKDGSYNVETDELVRAILNIDA